ncbi:hypothetical protein POM88_040682 [Heracleum sosnowskyi]|uniref:DUF6598 domain-containing protein n=1 Tax=Heracleum sosnowskyi TaxID=360622 RepID=A0AAD8HDM0_9APIA|nr:hypothetical protein POM88_040682 [Heracleum sosnowskyi]
MSSGETIKSALQIGPRPVKNRHILVERISTHQVHWFDVRCEPVIDVLHARFLTNTTRTSLQVFGYIKVIDIQGSENFPLFDRGQFKDPQRLHPSSPLGNYLQLGGPDDIPNFIDPRVCVNIKNVDTGDVVAHGEQCLLKSTQLVSTSDDAFEKLYTLQFQGNAEDDLVELQCVAFTFGAYAEVQVFLYYDNPPETYKIHEDDDDDEYGVDVFGLIYAHCDPLHLPKDKYKNHIFTVVKEEHEWVRMASEIDLSKSLVAVPAYSDLKITLDLEGFEDDEFSVQGTVSFGPGNYYSRWSEVRGKNGYYARVHVRYLEPSLLNKRCCKEDVIDGFSDMPHSPGSYVSRLIEVFSLFIARPNDEEVNLYGSVSIYGVDGWCNIFSRSEEEAYFLPSGCNLLPMKGPDQAVRPGSSFSVAVDLSDVDGHVKINGFALSSYGIDERQRPWYDRRLCSVVRSEEEKSFVAIHYTVFSFAPLAIVTVQLECQHGSSDHVKVYGDIIASYDKLSYLTNYDKQFFRRVLFTRKEANSLKLEENLVLSRSVVAVPSTSSLLAEVNLSFQTEEGAHSAVKVVKKIEIGESYTTPIKSDMVEIGIHVDWKGLPYY